jgi:hypothetical protein
MPPIARQRSPDKPIEIDARGIISGLLALKVLISLWAVDFVVAPLFVITLFSSYGESRLAGFALAVISVVFLLLLGAINVFVVWAIRGLLLFKPIPTALAFAGALSYCTAFNSFPEARADMIVTLAAAAFILGQLVKDCLFAGSARQ